MAAQASAERLERSFASFAFGSSGAAILALIGLHVLDQAFDPSWRMVSEYALGEAAWLLSLMFVCWALGSWALAAATIPHLRPWQGKLGATLLVVAGVGEFLAAIFDVSHPLHGVAALIGIPSLPAAALLLSLSSDGRRLFGRSFWMRALTHLTWISLCLMIGAMIVLMTTFQQAGGDMTGGMTTTLPAGTVAFNGWANRFLIIAYCLWAMSAAWRLRSTPA